jgi:hypothetical protein
MTAGSDSFSMTEHGWVMTEEPFLEAPSAGYRRSPKAYSLIG